MAEALPEEVEAEALLDVEEEGQEVENLEEEVTDSISQAEVELAYQEEEELAWSKGSAM